MYKYPCSGKTVNGIRCYSVICNMCISFKEYVAIISLTFDKSRFYGSMYDMHPKFRESQIERPYLENGTSLLRSHHFDSFTVATMTW